MGSLLTFLIVKLSLCLNHRHFAATVAGFAEANHTIGESKQGMVFTNTNVYIRVMFGTALANDDVTSFYDLAAEYFNAQTFAVRFATVFTTTCAFFMCHEN